MFKTDSLSKKKSASSQNNQLLSETSQVSKLNFEDKKRICQQIENAQYPVLIQIYNTITKENPQLPIKKTKKGILFSFNKLNSVSLNKIIDILDKENKERKKQETETVCFGNLAENNMFKQKKHTNSQDKDLIFYLLEKNIKKTKTIPKKSENKPKRKPHRKKKETKTSEINYKSDDSIDLYIKSTSKIKITDKNLFRKNKKNNNYKNSDSSEESTDTELVNNFQSLDNLLSSEESENSYQSSDDNSSFFSSDDWGDSDSSENSESSQSSDKSESSQSSDKSYYSDFSDNSKSSNSESIFSSSKESEYSFISE